MLAPEADDHTKGEMGTINLETSKEEALDTVTAGAVDADIVASAAVALTAADIVTSALLML